MKKLIFAAGSAAAILLIAGCASPAIPQAPAAITVTAAPTPVIAVQSIAVPPITAAPPPTALSTTTEALVAATTSPPAAPAPAPAPAVMPDVVCLDLQQAQDTIQGAGVFFSRSDDATGQGRAQVLDRNWIVVAQTPAAGSPVGELEAVLSVVKDDEPNPC